MEKQADKPVIALYDLKHPAILAEAPTGVVYTNQSGGVMCHHPEAEGFLIPLPPIEAQVFDPSWWYEGFYGIALGPLLDLNSDYYKTEDTQERWKIMERASEVRQKELNAVNLSYEAVWEIMALKVNDALKYDANVKNFKIEADERNEEAWVRCSFDLRVSAVNTVYSNGGEGAVWSRSYGWLTWENCD